MNDVLVSIRRTPYQSLATFFALFFTLFLSIVILFLMAFLHGMLGYIESRPQVTVYFKTQTAENEIFKVRDELAATNKVASVKYVSKSEAFKIYKELNKDNPLLLEMVSSDILPPSLEIFAKQPSFLPEIADMLKDKGTVDEVNFQKVIIDRLINLTNVLRKTSLVFFLFLFFNTMVTLLTLGHFKIALKKDEIELLRYLGASKFYIQKPFIFEGVIFGFFSSLTAFLIFLAIILYTQPFLDSYLRGINNLTVDLANNRITVWPFNYVFLTGVFFITAFFGISISTITTLFATKKYIK